MLQLPHGCSCSEPTVKPKNWNIGGRVLLEKDWYIQYYFRDPVHKVKYPRGKFVILKRMNMYKTLPERRAAVKLLLANELDLLQNWEYNPITGFNKKDSEQVDYGISPTTPLIEALHQALKRITVEVETRRDIKSIIKYMAIAAQKVGYDSIIITDIRKKHIKVLLDQQETLQIVDGKGNLLDRKWTAARYNVYWKYLHRLFEELIELEVCEFNPVAKISKKAVITRMRLTMSKEERREVINVHLRKEHYTFYRFCQVFFHSSARETELLRIRASDVDMKRQRYKIIIKKGRNQHEEERTIKDLALPFWEELMLEAGPDEYLFSKDLRPGDVKINASQITRRWKRHCKDKLGVKADIYSLKHSHLDEVASILSSRQAQKSAGHTSLKTTEGYLHGQAERDHSDLRKLDNEL